MKKYQTPQVLLCKIMTDVILGSGEVFKNEFDTTIVDANIV